MENLKQVIHDYADRMNLMEEDVLFIYNLVLEEKEKSFKSGMKRHTWMKSGVTYVGSGFYTLKDALESARKDGLIK